MPEHAAPIRGIGTLRYVEGEPLHIMLDEEHRLRFAEQEGEINDEQFDRHGRDEGVSAVFATDRVRRLPASLRTALRKLRDERSDILGTWYLWVEPERVNVGFSYVGPAVGGSARVRLFASLLEKAIVGEEVG